MTRLALSQTLDWMGLRCQVPEDWQLVRHGLSPEVGRLVLVDRREQRLTLWWRQCARRPDLDRMLHDFREQARGETPGCELEPFRCAGPWRGWMQSSRGADRVLARAVTYHAPTSRLVEALAVTHRDAPAERDLVRHLLGAVQVTAAARASTRWRVFGIDLTTPPCFRLVRTAIQPADAALTFARIDPQSGKPTRAEAEVRRLGMADAWFTGDLRQVVARCRPRASFSKLDQVAYRGAPALFAQGLEPGPRWQRALGRLRTECVLAWECEPENSVYQLCTRSFSSRPLLPQELRVHFATPEAHGKRS